MLSLRDSDAKLPTWSLVYLATISTSWPRSKGICTFTSAAPKASWDRDRGDRNLERKPYSSPPQLWLILSPSLALPCPHCGSPCGHRSAPLRPHTPQTQPLAQVILMPQSLGCPCHHHKARMLPLCSSGLELPSPSWPEHGGAWKASPQWLSPGPTGGGEGNARIASS